MRPSEVYQAPYADGYFTDNAVVYYLPDHGNHNFKETPIAVTIIDEVHERLQASDAVQHS
jgi:hypothetical protein